MCAQTPRPHRPSPPTPPSPPPPPSALCPPHCSIIREVCIQASNVCPNPLRPQRPHRPHRPRPQRFVHPHCSIGHRLHSSAIVPTWFLCPWFGLEVKFLEVSNVCPNPLRPHALTALNALTAPTALSALSTPLPPLLTAFCPWFGLCTSL